MRVKTKKRMKIMKKLFVLLAAITVSTSVASAQDWGIGGRLGYGLQVVGQKYFFDDNYVEARLGFGYNGSWGPDITMLYYWNVKNWDWTPGNWSLDIGAGANTVISKNYMFLGVQISGKFGYTFEDIPLTLSADFSPTIGPNIGLRKGYGTTFWADGLFTKFGLGCIYRF
jgi:hypothetical protein